MSTIREIKPECELWEDCDDSEHFDCALLKCPHNEPLHNHHDGCPACENA